MIEQYDIEDDDGQGWAYLLELEQQELEEEVQLSKELKEINRHEYRVHDSR